MPMDGWSMYCLRKIRIAAFLFCALLGLVAAIFLLVYVVRQWVGYNVLQRVLVLTLSSINALTAVVLITLVVVTFHLWMTTFAIAALLILQVGGTTVFTLFVPNFPCHNFWSENTCRQLTSMVIIGLWTLPGVLFFCTAWLLLMAFVIRPSLAKGSKTPSIIKSLDVKTDEWSSSAQSQQPRSRFSVSTYVASPTQNSFPLSTTPPVTQQEQTQVYAYDGITKDNSQDLPYGTRSPKSPQLVDKISQWRKTMDFPSLEISPILKEPPPVLDAINNALSFEEVETVQKSLISSPSSIYSTLPDLGAQYRIELRLPGSSQQPSTSNSRSLSLSSSNSTFTNSSHSAPATAPYRFPNPAAYTRPPFSSSPLSRSFVPSNNSSGPAPGNLARRNPMNSIDRSIRRGSAFPVSPVSRRLTPISHPRSLAARQASQPLVDRYGMRATVTSKTFKDLRDMDRERMRRRDTAADSQW